MRGRAIAATVLVACAWLPAAARAEGPRVLFVATAPTPFSARVRAEIEAMGFSIEPSDALGGGGAPTTVAAARVIEEPPPRRIELWIMNASGGRLELRAVIQPSTDDDEATQTVRASEQLRAFFQPLREPTPSLLLPPTPRPPLDGPAPTARAPQPALSGPPPGGAAASRVVVSAAVAVPLQPGGPGVDVALRGRWMATRALGLGAIVSVPIAGSTVTSTEGSSSVAAALFGAELSAVLLESRSLRLAASAGVAVAWLRTSGSASAPYAGRSDSVVTGLPFLGVEIAPRLADRVRLYLGGHAAVSLPRADIAFNGKTVASWARPLGILSGGVSVDF